MSYIAKLINKRELQDGRLEVTVEYTDGVDSKTETFIPQDKQGYFYRTEEVKRSLNTAKELKLEDNLGKEVVLTTIDTRTQAQKDKDLWIQRDFLKEQVDKAIAKGYLTGTEPKVVQLNSWLKTNFKPEYINLV
jgi:hypothetical protein